MALYRNIAGQMPIEGGEVAMYDPAYYYQPPYTTGEDPILVRTQPYPAPEVVYDIQINEPVTTIDPVNPVQDPGAPSTPAAGDTTPTTTTVEVVSTPERDYISLLAMAVVVVSALRGPQVFGRYNSVALLGGLGALYYQHSKLAAPKATT